MPLMHILSVRKICNLIFEFSVRGWNGLCSGRSHNMMLCGLREHTLVTSSVFSDGKRWVFLRLCFRCGLSDRRFYDVFLIRFQGSTVSVGLPVYVL